MTYTHFERKDCTTLRNELNDLLTMFAEDNGLDIKVGNMSFSDNHISAKVEISTINENGAVNTKEAEAFKREAKYFGLEAEDFGREFKMSGDTYEIIGLKPRSRKYPILAKNKRDGKSYKFPAETIANFLKAAA